MYFFTDSFPHFVLVLYVVLFFCRRASDLYGKNTYPITCLVFAII